MRQILTFLLLFAATFVAGCASTPRSSETTVAGGQAEGNYRPLSELRLAPYSGPGDASRAPRDRRDDAPIAQAPETSPRATDDSRPGGVVLGEGDVIEFRMFGQPEMTTTAYISSQGTVSLPLLQQVEVGGLTPGEVEVKVADAYRAGGYFNDPQVNINIAQYRSQQIAVLGEVARAGRYPLETRTGVLDALAQAGGVTPQGSRTVTIIRQTGDGARRFRLSLDRLVTKTGDLDDFKLVAGDTVFVPEARLFYIYGEVRRPDAYAIRPGMMVMQAITMGGGLTERGSNSRIVIHREEDGVTRSFAPELTDTIEPDDVIFVKERFF